MEPKPKFPSPIPAPSIVEETRRIRYHELLSSSLKGVLVRVLIAVTELIASFIFGSAVLFMDALSTGFDILTSLALVVSFKLATKPPDRNHPLGHGRLEPLAGFQLGVFLAILGAYMLFYNSYEITSQEPAVLNPFLWIIPLISIGLLEACYRHLMKIAEKQNSPALAADAVHYRVDSITSFFAMIALLLASVTPGYGQISDYVGAALIALFMIGIGLKAARDNMHQILDKKPSKDYFEKIKKAALRADGVKGTEKIRMQLYGPDAYIAIDIEVDPDLSVLIAHEISQKVRFEIQKEIPEARDVIVHIEPFYPNDHHD